MQRSIKGSAELVDSWKISGIARAENGEHSANLIVGVPYEGGGLDRHGQSEATWHIRSAGWGHNQPFIGSNGKPVHASDMGDVHPLKFGSTMKARGYKYDRLLVIGGDHSITQPVVNHLHGKHEHLQLVVFDSHIDREPVGTGVNHENWLNYVTVPSAVIRPTTAHNIVLEETLTDRFGHGWFNRPTYISVDLDYISLGEAPGVGTPCPGGVAGLAMLEQMVDLADALGENLIGVDVVEVTPPFDTYGQTSHLARNILLSGAIS